MRKKICFLMVLPVFLAHITAAQISLHPHKTTEQKQFSVDRDAGGGLIMKQEKAGATVIDAALIRYKEVTTRKYERIQKKIKNGKDIEDMSKRRQSLYVLHRYYDSVDKVVKVYDPKLKENVHNAQATTGMNFFSTESGSRTAAAVQLGGRLNNLRLSLPTKTRFRVDPLTNDEDTGYTLHYSQTRNFLYFDIISRGLVSFDSIARTVSDYISSADGSLLTGRLKFNANLMPRYLRSDATGHREPSLHWVLNLDGRMVPVASATKIDAAGFSAHAITGLVFLVPSGQAGTQEQDDDFIVQLMFNSAYLTESVMNALMPAESGYERRRVVMSAELRVGNYSKIDPLRNFSAFVKYGVQSTIGPQWTTGISFTPQGKDTSTDD